jgi:hypothetical protein
MDYDITRQICSSPPALTHTRQRRNSVMNLSTEVRYLRASIADPLDTSTWVCLFVWVILTDSSDAQHMDYNITRPP